MSEYMEKALELARIAYEEGEVPVGAVVVKKSTGEIIGEGRNKRENSRNALAHAEILAIDEACKKLGGWRLPDCAIYVTLEPCPMCCGAIISSRIDDVYFGAFDKKAALLNPYSGCSACRTTINPRYTAESVNANAAACCRISSVNYERNGENNLQEVIKSLC